MGIELSGISYAYDGRAVLSDLSLSVAQGHFSVILGRNGSGKSTLLRLASGMTKLQNGEVRIGGHRLDRFDQRTRAAHVGYLAQFHLPVFSFSVRDVVLTGRAAVIKGVPGKADLAAASEAMAALGIQELSSRPYDELSGGERQLVMIARLLAQRPTTLILDEPVSHLDLANQTRLLHALHGLTRQGITILAVLHDPNHALLFADEIVHLHQGRIEKPTEDIADTVVARLEHLYGIPLAEVEADGITAVVPVPPKKKTP